MSEPASVGDVLRRAREEQGITLDDAAARLRLMHRQVVAMETDDFASLGQAVFARGFVRNYARLLGLAPDTLLARMAGAPVETTAVRHAAVAAPTSWLSSPWLIALLLGVLLLLALPVGLYWWLNSEAEDDRPAATGAVLRDMPPAAPPLAPAPALPAPVVASPVVPPAGAAPAGVPAAPALAGNGEAGAPAASAAGRGTLHFEFGAQSWLEIRDGSGRTLLRQMNPAGTRVDVQGQPPFDLVIGNAAQARMSYNGRAIDLNPFVEATSARFTLE